MKFVRVCVCVMCVCMCVVCVGCLCVMCVVCALCVCGVCFVCVWHVWAVESGQGEHWGIASRAWWWHKVAAIAPPLPGLM